MSTTTLTPVAELEALYAELPSIACQRKCQACCTIAPYTPLEADRMYRWTGSKKPITKVLGYDEKLVDAQMKAESKEAALSIEMPTCPLLSAKGACTVHPVRPLVCRLWGVTEGLECPHGCEVTPRLLTFTEANEFWARGDAIFGRWEQGMPNGWVSMSEAKRGS